ncbi:ABC transporter permease subunit [Vibrio metschnikovii]|uniref:ABC transporter permease subunit n=1 Tax=Vibrio metschnikovii TaxID=28172 RepID=UPI0029FE27D3|nr:ABC transporter permease subunit [Vibrio metschnikovii]
MPHSEFSLQQRDHKRRLKDRCVRFAVTCGGVGVLAALILIFVYLALVTLPLFADAKLDANFAKQPISSVQPQVLAMDDYGEHLFVVDQYGEAEFWALKQPSDQPLWRQPLSFVPVKIEAVTAQDGWYAVLDAAHQVHLFRPRFDYSITQQRREFTPVLESLSTESTLVAAPEEAVIEQFNFALTADYLYTVSYLADQRVMIRWLARQAPLAMAETVLPTRYAQLDQLLITPDGQTIYLRTGSQLAVIQRDGEAYRLREQVDLSRGQPQRLVTNMTLLSGAYSLLVTYENGVVSQWFDVLQQGQRQLQSIRDFQLAPSIQLLLTDTQRKGFYTFYPNGTLQSHYTTSEKLVLFERVFPKAPTLAVMSNNERYIATWDDGIVQVIELDNPHPEISFSALWKKVWYEGYPEPQFVWQSTAANEQFEPKLSLVPIAFGTLKAAFYAMLFAVPIAVFAAIYTAYFMKPAMRRVVKPTIELMEALPTVIIGFLAGLWFAPIVENNLAAVVTLLIGLPISTLMMGVIWSWLPKRYLGYDISGWQALILVPLMIVIMALTLSFSHLIEQVLFAGDVLLFLDQRGIGFDQRNALIVGIAMGFAVIPTIFTIAEDAIFSVPKHLSDGSLALGATGWQTLTHVVLLTASPGIFSAIMMGLGRAVGETMIVLMATGNTPILDWNILQGMRTISANIAIELPESAVGSSHYRVLFLAALLLFVFTFIVNSFAEWVRQRLRAKYRSL